MPLSLWLQGNSIKRLIENKNGETGQRVLGYGLNCHENRYLNFPEGM